LIALTNASFFLKIFLGSKKVFPNALSEATEIDPSVPAGDWNE